MSDTKLAIHTVPLEVFREKLQKRVREDIADLLPEDAVASLVQKAVEDTFFKTRRRNDGSEYNPRWVESPSWFVEAVAKEAKPILERTVAAYIKEHEAEVQKAVSEYLTPQNLTVLAVGTLSANISAALYSLAQTIQNKV